MAKTYQSIIDNAEVLLQDEATDQTLRRWKETELLTWAKEGEHQIVKEKPDANPVVTSTLLSAGSQQAIAATDLQLLDVLCNMGTDGSTRGDVVSVVERSLMNTIEPGWMKKTAANVVTHVIYDVKRAPRLYWVYPPSTGSNYLEIMTAQLPANSSKVIGDNIILSDEYSLPLMHFIIAMAFAKDADIPQSAELMQAHMAIFLQYLGKRDVLEHSLNPKRTRTIT